MEKLIAELILGFGKQIQAKYFQGAKEFSFMDLGEIDALFLGSKGAKTPP